MFWFLNTILWHSHFPVEDSFQKSCVRTMSDWRGWMYVHVFVLHCVASVPCYILWLEGLAEHHLPRAAERRVSQSLGCTDGGVQLYILYLFICWFDWIYGTTSRTLSARRLPLTAMTQVMVRLFVCLFVCVHACVCIFVWHCSPARPQQCYLIPRTHIFVSAGLVL